MWYIFLPSLKTTDFLFFVLSLCLADSWTLRVFRGILGLATANTVVARAFSLKKGEWTQAASGWGGLWATTSRTLLRCNSHYLLLPSSRCLSAKESLCQYFLCLDQGGFLIRNTEAPYRWERSILLKTFTSELPVSLHFLYRLGKLFWLDVVRFLSLGQVPTLSVAAFELVSKLWSEISQKFLCTQHVKIVICLLETQNVVKFYQKTL